MSYQIEGDQKPMNDPTMRDVWCWALGWFRMSGSALDRHKRLMQVKLVEAIKDEIDSQLQQKGLPLYNVPALHQLYELNNKWLFEIARRLYPKDWQRLSLQTTTAAAFGLRYVEYMVNRKLDANKPLPHWVGEWAVW